MTEIRREFGLAIRTLLRAPLMLLTVVLTLAVGIGLSTGVLAVAYGLLVKPLPYAEPHRLVTIAMYRAVEPDKDIGLKLPMVEEWRRRARAFAGVAAYAGAEFTLRGAGETRSVRGAMVTDGFFEVLGVPPAEGTTRAIAGVMPSAALSAALADQIGRSGAWRERGLMVGSAHFAASAIMPRSFACPSDKFDVWLPAAAVPEISFFSNHDQRDFKVIARLRPDVTLAQAQDDAARVAAELNEPLPDGRRRYATVKPFGEDMRQKARATLLPFAAGSLVVLLIAGANVSGLLAGRAAARRREFAIRRALGGGTKQLLRAAVAESVTIAVCGWLAGLWIAYLVVRGFVTLGADVLGNLQAARIDWAVASASLVLSILVSLAGSIAPLLRAVRSDAGAVLKQTSERTGRGHARTRGLLVVTQIALTVVLLVCAGLLTRTVMNVVAAERGFELRHALTSRLLLGEGIRFNVTDRLPLLDRLLAEVRSMPGVVAAGVGSDLPPGGTQIMMTVRIITENRDETIPLNLSAVTPGYLEAIGATLVGGRLFEERDRVATVPSVVITESAARKLLGGREAVGAEWPATIPTPKGNVKPRVIGVVRDVKYGGLDRTAPPGIFAPWDSIAPTQAFLVVRTTGDPLALAPAVRQTVQHLDPALPAFPPKSLEEVVAGSMADRRMRLQLAAVFAALALVLASVALWGAVAQSVVERRRELAIRLALGSTHRGAVALVVRSGVVLIAIGVGAGVLGAALSARGLQHLLHGVAPLDPATFAAGVGVAAVVSLCACYFPARRAASISPTELLRET